MTKRRQARELALKGLYAYEIHHRDTDVIFDDLAGDSSLGEEHLKFARSLLEMVIENFEFLDKEIMPLETPRFSQKGG